MVTLLTVAIRFPALALGRWQQHFFPPSLPHHCHRLSPVTATMSPRYGATHVEHDASKQWNAVEDQYEIEVARCYQKWGRRMPPRSHVAEYLRWDSMREDELDRLKVQRDKALKAIPMNRTPGVRSKSTPPKRPPRPVSPPTSYALSAITSMVADTPQPLAKSVESDASGKPPRPARRPRPVSAISVASSSVTHRACPPWPSADCALY